MIIEQMYYKIIKMSSGIFGKPRKSDLLNIILRYLDFFYKMYIILNDITARIHI